MRRKQRRHQRHSKTLSIHPILGETADTFFREQRSAVRHPLVVQHQYRSRSLRVVQILSGITANHVNRSTVQGTWTRLSSLFRIRRQQDDLPDAAFLP
jgi:hypothetical protein